MSSEDGFFSLGGDSILVISAVVRIRAGGFEVAVKDFFLQPTLAGLAATAKKVQPAAPAAAATTEIDHGLSDEDLASILDQIS